MKPMYFEVPSCKFVEDSAYGIQAILNAKEEYEIKCSTAWDKIAACRWVKENCQAARVIELNEEPDLRTGGEEGALLDLMTANMICSIWDAIKDELKVKVIKHNLGYTVHMFWKFAS